MTPLAILLLGFILGVRHATDPDHVVAVSTIVSRERSLLAAMWIGTTWGIGHTVTILVVGGAIIAFKLVIPPRLGLTLELSVAAMLVVLGLFNLTSTMQRSVEVGGHPRRETSVSLNRFTRPLLVGVVHGLAGSAAIALLVLGTVHGAGWASLYLGVFGLGTIAGMMLLTTAMMVPLAEAARRFASFDRGLARATGLLSLAFGLYLGYRIGYVDGLFLAQPQWSPQ
jgi:high-affinity nickel-transport protein